MRPTIELQDLWVRVGAMPLVHGISISIEPGESLALLGQSGSGKSLTAAAITGSLSRLLDAEGALTIDGAPIDITSAARPGRCVASIQQDSSSALNPLVRIAHQLEVPLREGGLLRSAAHTRAAELLASCGIDDPQRVLQSYPAELSGGQRQRVCIALALACEARILVADEPTTALDVVSQAQVLETLAQVRARTGMALLFITHDIAAASQVCDHAVVLEAGHVVEQGSFTDLVTDPQHAYSRSLVETVRQGGHPLAPILPTQSVGPREDPA